ncbi:hypothetical protein [Erythrobacter mangrovi]|uniref:Uncharacterized protein n=1 Tax=Erythrobacter mangrovi TaxID=2739433 RepID=A0A7D4BWM7_9SPHN|nr:hypothetical protein [Erythrobacter mangrovi]QKG72027.1 hypothetical protein HQR01_11990 [Erythrobacter mangrovi]
MSDANFASLTPTLLARKGGAKPAMRPQSGIPGPVDGKEAAANLEDLGWNDMGDDEAATTRSETATRSEKVVAIAPQAANESGAPNQVRESLSRIAAHLEKPVPESRPAPRKPAKLNGRRAAFTLRLDHERHLMLRLACTVRGRSAQQIVTDALDSLLAEMPEIASLAAQVQKSEH